MAQAIPKPYTKNTVEVPHLMGACSVSDMRGRETIIVTKPYFSFLLDQAERFCIRHNTLPSKEVSFHKTSTAPINNGKTLQENSSSVLIVTWAGRKNTSLINMIRANIVHDTRVKVIELHIKAHSFVEKCVIKGITLDVIQDAAFW